MPELLSASFLVAAAVAVVAGMVRGFAGFGAAMMMTPVFSALYGPAVGVALCLLLEVAVAMPLVPGVVRLVDWRGIGLLLVGAAVIVVAFLLWAAFTPSVRSVTAPGRVLASDGLVTVAAGETGVVQSLSVEPEIGRAHV